MSVTEIAAPGTKRSFEPRPMTMVNLSSSVLRLVRIEGNVAADRLPRLGVLLRRGEQLRFGVAPSPRRDDGVIAHFEVADAAGRVCGQRYSVAIGHDRIAASSRHATSSEAAQETPPLTQLHLTQDHVVLRNVSR